MLQRTAAGGLTPRQALLISIGAAIVTMGMKTIAWWQTGSIGYLSDALESLVNLAGASFALAMVTYAQQPPDRHHPYGHGKAEYFSAAFEGALIFIAAVVILLAAGERLFHPRPLGALGLATTLSVAASVVNLLVARLLLRVSRTHRSIALEADARHLMADVWTTAGVVIGVAIAGLTGLHWLDPLVAAAVALNILREGWQLMRRATSGLMDHALEPVEIEQVKAVLEGCASHGCTYANLRTRVSGALRFAHVEIRVPGDWSVTRAHDLADALERAVAQHGITLTTHIEPVSRHTPMT